MIYKPEAPNVYQGNQVILNSDRLLFNAKQDSVLLFANKNIGFSVNGSFHFDTSSDKNTSNFIVNSPNIFLGLDKNKLPTEPAVLGDELHDLLHKILDTIYMLTADIEFKISYVITSPGGLTTPNPSNTASLQSTRNRIQKLVREISKIKSEITKIA